jgi:hypothetical protein
MTIPARAPESGRSYALARPLLLIAWALVFWGTLVAGAIVWKSVELGPATAIGRLVSGTSTGPPTVGYVNLACAVFAVAAWTTLAVLLVKRRRDDVGS